MVNTTSLVSLIAHDFMSKQSNIALSLTSFTDPSVTSIPTYGDFDVSAYNLAIISSAFNPAFSANVLGITSKAYPNFSTAY